jgi:hypothetical protein
VEAQEAQDLEEVEDAEDADKFYSPLKDIQIIKQIIIFIAM